MKRNTVCLPDYLRLQKHLIMKYISMTQEMLVASTLEEPTLGKLQPLFFRVIHKCNNFAKCN